MNGWKWVVISGLLPGWCASVGAADENVALNATVTLHGAAFLDGDEALVSADTLVDGLFFPRNHQWNDGPVWWGIIDGQERYITIDLGDVFEITGFIVQADDNDAYILSYWDLEEAVWKLAWHIPNYDTFPDFYNRGMQTRPNPDDDIEQYRLEIPILTDALKLEGDMEDSDMFFSVSEIQAYGGQRADAIVDFDPDVLNLRSKGRWITCYLAPPEGFDATDIAVESILLEDLLEAQRSELQDDLLMIKFDRRLLSMYLATELEIAAPAEVSLTISGQMTSGTPFQASGSIFVK